MHTLWWCGDGNLQVVCYLEFPPIQLLIFAQKPSSSTWMPSNTSTSILATLAILNKDLHVFQPLKFLETKTGWLLFGQLVWRKIKKFQFFLLVKWTTYVISFLWTQSTSNSDSVWARGAKKKSLLSIESWFFTFFHFLVCTWFCMMSPSMWLLRAKCEVFSFFQEILQGP